MKDREIVINRCWGGFSLSPEATIELYKLGETSIASPVREYFGLNNKALTNTNAAVKKAEARIEKEITKFESYLRGENKSSFITTFSPDRKYVLSSRDIARDNPNLIKIVKKLKDKANGPCAQLEIVSIPSDIEWEIDEYDGMEKVEEVHRSWS